MSDMADDAADVIAKLGLRRVAVVGWSMGGMIAQQLVSGSPRGIGIDRLVLLSTAPPGAQATPLAPEVNAVLSEHGPDAFAKIMGALFPADAVGDAERCFAGDMFAPSGYKEIPIAEAVSAQQNRAMKRWFANDAAASALRRITVPTLIVAGARDGVLADANSTVLNRLIAHSRLAIVDDAGHAMMFQYPRELARLIDGFIGR